MKTTARSPGSLADSIQFLPGVGPRLAEHFQRLGVRTVGDLLEYLPARNEQHEALTIEHLDEGVVATIVGQITAVGGRRYGHGGGLSATLTDNTGRCGLRWFNADWARDKIRPGVVIRATGQVRRYRDLPQMVNPRFVVLGPDAKPVDESEPSRFEGVYPATAELPSRTIARVIHANLDRMLDLVEEWHPPAWLRERNLPSRRSALAAYHRPQADREVDSARRRLAYDELLLMQVAVALSRHHREATAKSPEFRCTPEIDARIRRRFPFTLTAGQERALAPIVADLARPRPMNRLLQGDVGSGKTVVALYAALVAVAHRCQVAIMAPTELLAEQHHRSIARYLANSRVRHALLTGGLRTAERRDLLRRIEDGGMDLVVGTHALIQEDVQFARLGLTVVDEQHRFGVRQRATIRSKGLAPHYLVMTATPIPRTLAMTVFGDLDVAVIDEMPPGRVGIDTRVLGPRLHDAAWEFVRARLAAGEQAFVVYPLIDESDKLDLRAATTEFERLQRQVFAGRAVGLLHGRMPTAEREAVMGEFAAGRLAVLVATTVVEVGIDVPNATCMVVEHAERYGLSQLHQLRGRIGRGTRKGYCLLLAGSTGAAENERLAVLSKTTDGFRIAEEDLRLRGPGEMLGTRQHGLPELRVADLLNDGELLRLAQQDAQRIVREDPSLLRPERRVLRTMLAAKYAEAIRLLDVG